jgi:hypothetical protein
MTAGFPEFDVILFIGHGVLNERELETHIVAEWGERTLMIMRRALVEPIAT